MRLKFKSLKPKISNFFKFLAQRSFFFCLFLLFLALFISLLIFFKYSNLVKKEIFPSKVEKFKLKEFEEISKILQNKKVEFEKIDQKEYKNPF